MKYTARRVKEGLYEYTFENGLVFNIVKVRDADRATDNRMWYWVNKDDDYDGGHDWYYSKREALATLVDYIQHRKYVKPYGWCYVPD